MDSHLTNIILFLCIGTVLSTVPPEFLSKLLWLPDDARSTGVHLMAGKGSGKSRLMGRVIAWLDFLRGTPVVIFDPVGQTLDNFLDKLTRLPRDLQEQLWPRVLYVDMSGRNGRVIPFPLYYRFGNEGLYEVSQRYLDVIRKLDPNLHSASIYGWNQVHRTGTAVGMVLTALGLQITEAEDLIRNPDQWNARFYHALQSYPELQSAVTFFEEFSEWKEETRLQKSDAFLNKIALFGFDPSMKAMFGATTPGVDLAKAVELRRTILFDFRHVQDIEIRRFKMVWAFNYVLSYIKYRGAGRHRPISLIIDELTALFAVGTLSTELFASELDELINVLARNYMIWLTIAHQELFQLNERMQKTLRTMGTQILGVTTDREAALALARDFFPYDPYLVKKSQPVYSSFRGMSEIIDYQTTEFTMEEQAVLNSYTFTNQRRFQFLVKAAQREGDMHGTLRPVTLEHFDEGLYVNEALVSEARTLLMERRGRRIDEVLAEIDARQVSQSNPRVSSPRQAEEIPAMPDAPFATMKSDVPATYDEDEDNPTVFGEKKTKKNTRPRRQR